MRPQLLSARKAKKRTRVHQMPAKPKPCFPTTVKVASTMGKATAITLYRTTNYEVPF